MGTMPQTHTLGTHIDLKLIATDQDRHSLIQAQINGKFTSLLLMTEIQVSIL